jgi:hypothetical protein
MYVPLTTPPSERSEHGMRINDFPRWIRTVIVRGVWFTLYRLPAIANVAGRLEATRIFTLRALTDTSGGASNSW